MHEVEGAECESNQYGADEAFGSHPKVRLKREARQNHLLTKLHLCRLQLF